MDFEKQRDQLKSLREKFESLPESQKKKYKIKKKHSIEEDLPDSELGFAIEVMELVVDAVTADAQRVAAESKVASLTTNPFSKPLPPLGRPLVKLSSPHVGTNYPSVKTSVGVAPKIDELPLHKEFASFIFGVESLDYSSEASVQDLVCFVLHDCAKALNGGGALRVPIRVQREAALLHLFPDHVFFQTGTHVGVCEVKKPSTEDVKVFDEPGMFGQVFSYLLLLRSYFGIRWCFCILSTYEEWAICYLDDCKEIAKLHCVDDVEKFCREEQDAIDAKEKIYSGKMSLKNTLNFPTIKIPSAKRVKAGAGIRKLYRSKVIRFDDPQLANHLAAAMYMMAKSPRSRVLSLDGERLLVTAKSSTWEELPASLDEIRLTDFVCADVQAIYLLEDLGRGAEGKCFLACDAEGRSCVAKFHYVESKSKKDAKKTVREHLAAVKLNWLVVFGIDCILFAKELVLLTPYFHAVDWDAEDSKSKHRGGVVAALRKIAAAHRIHSDLKWEHVMLKNASEVVIVDLNCEIVDNQTEEQLLSSMMKKLGV